MLAVTPGNWVCDGAEVLSEDTENTVRTYNTTFDQSYSAYVAVATVPSLKGWDADAYAEELFNRWSLQGNDFLLMLDIGGNQSYLYNGSNYTNFNFSSYLDTYVNTDFFAGNYDAAVTGLMAGMESYLSQYNGGYSPENGVTPAEDTGNYTDYAQMEQQTNLLSGVIIVLALLAVVYSGVFGCIWLLEHKHASPKGRIVISGKAALVAVVMAAMVFAVSNLLFLGDREVDMSVYYIRTLVDICGVLILTVQHEQLREAALHSELAAMDEVLHRQYEQYKRSKEGIRLINSRYHELKIQIADIRAERDRAKQDAALARMESGIRQYEAENKTGNPVLDTLLTAKSMDCQQRGINMTSVADGSQLGFLSTRELCTLVGAPLDNAIECVTAEPDPEKRLLRVAIYAQSGFVMLRFENYCAQPVELGPDGLPLRSAHGGYDLKSVRAAAEAHGAAEHHGGRSRGDALAPAAFFLCRMGRHRRAAHTHSGHSGGAGRALQGRFRLRCSRVLRISAGVVIIVKFGIVEFPIVVHKSTSSFFPDVAFSIGHGCERTIIRV